MIRPSNIQDLAPEIQAYINYLEQRLQDTDEDGVRGFLIVINRKMNQIKRSIDSYEFQIDSTEDKAFERFWMAATKFKELAKDMKEMQLEYGLSDKDIEAEKAVNPMERLARNKQGLNGRR